MGGNGLFDCTGGIQASFNHTVAHEEWQAIDNSFTTVESYLLGKFDYAGNFLAWVFMGYVTSAGAWTNMTCVIQGSFKYVNSTQVSTLLGSTVLSGYSTDATNLPTSKVAFLIDSSTGWPVLRYTNRTSAAAGSTTYIRSVIFKTAG